MQAELLPLSEVGAAEDMEPGREKLSLLSPLKTFLI